MRRRAWLVNALLALAAVVLGGALAETGLRLVYPQPLGVWHHDRAGLALHWPGLVTYLPQFGHTVSFSSAGMRDRERAVERPPGVFRVLVLGDSFMEALQVPFEASFPSLLERGLEGKAGKRFEVVNASVSGWGTDDHLQYLTTYGMKWRPDLVLVAMTLHNDISENLRERFHAMRNGSLVEHDRARPSPLGYRLMELKGFLATRSHAYQLGRHAWHGGAMRSEAGQLRSHVVELFREPTSERIARGLTLTGLLLESVRAVASADGSRVAVVLLPLNVQMSDEAFGGFVRSANESGAVMRVDTPQRLVRHVVERLGIPMIDLLPDFRRWTGEKAGALYLEGDGHWNENGHRLAADVVATRLIEQAVAR